MLDLGFDPFEAIADHSTGFASACAGNLAAPVRACPDWSVADLVWHLTEVHWHWRTIVTEHLVERLNDVRFPPRVPDDQLISTFLTGAERMVSVLRAADPADRVWTWAPAQQNVAFVTRHQVQEAAIHHWDALDAVGERLEIEAPVAADAVEEFLTFSVANELDHPEEPGAPLLTRFAIACTDAAASWTIGDGPIPGTVAFQRGADGGRPVLEATGSDLLLWLFKRIDLETVPVDPEVIERFRALCFTE